MFIYLLTMCVSGCVFAVNLFPCPDCEKDVSPYAVMCPNCGCPGARIEAAVAKVKTDEVKEKLKPIPLFQIDTGLNSGYGVGLSVGANKYLVMDARILWNASSLTITPLTTNSLITYSKLQLSLNSPLARFSTDDTNITYLTASQAVSSEKELKWILPDDGVDGYCKFITVEPDADTFQLRLVAVVDMRTNLVGVVYKTEEKYLYAMPIEKGWINTTPSIFRKQTSLLLRAEQEIKDDKLTAETRKNLSNTKWLTSSLKTEANKILKQNK